MTILQFVIAFYLGGCVCQFMSLVVMSFGLPDRAPLRFYFGYWASCVIWPLAQLIAAKSLQNAKDEAEREHERRKTDPPRVLCLSDECCERCGQRLLLPLKES